MVGVVIVAAGSGSRLGADIPKALVPLAGRPLVAWAVAQCVAAGLPAPVVVIPEDAREEFLSALDGQPVAAVVTGGATRSDSVRHGLEALDPGVSIVAVHDAARPLMPAEVIRQTVAAVGGSVLAAAPGLPIVDTVKRQTDGVVTATVPRDNLVAIQTPQVFVRNALAAVGASGASATDELTLLEAVIAAGDLTGDIRMVPGSAFGHKITTSEDLLLLEAVASRQLEEQPQ